MTVLTDTQALAETCERLSRERYVTVDTEFLRDRTYYPQLCLVQLGGQEETVAVDTLAPELDLAPLFDLMAAPDILKVFHAARQDIEIFVNLMGAVPAPLFDTQIAAMVCGFGDQIGYEPLVVAITGAQVDKSSRFTDWSHRPLSQRQIDYALSDVTHLRKVFEHLEARLDETGRGHWLEDEIAALTDQESYGVDPEESWRRLKPRTDKPKFLSILKSLAAWREKEAQRRNQPRNRILRDEALMEIASSDPADADALGRLRSMGEKQAHGPVGTAILAAVEEGRNRPKAERPSLPKSSRQAGPKGPLIELLRVLLKHKCETHQVAQKLLASAADLEAIALGSDDVPAFKGWRREVFGADAERLRRGQLAIGCDQETLVLFDRD
ncbi:MAG: ribonuclease D [Alphaproteobacteria bacterium]|nr:ribonuclease D [Alphaproteobacteria bacterium]